MDTTTTSPSTTTVVTSVSPTAATPHTTNDHSCPCRQVIPSTQSTSCKLCQRTLFEPDQQHTIQLEQKVAAQAQEIARLETALREKNEAFERLQLDMHTLNQKYVAEIDRVADVQHEKDLVEHELEELSCRLFEEANGMVATEKREKWQLENQLQQTREHLVAEQSQLRELPSANQTLLYRKPQSLKDQHTLAGGQRVASMPPLPSQPKQWKSTTIDELQLEAFRQFVQSSRTTPLKKLYQFAYMKHCQIEDIEPCLRFGPHSRLSVKKMMDYLSRQPCFIEQVSEPLPPTTHPPNPSSAAQRPLWERFSNNTKPTSGCSACGRPANSEHHPLIYRFKLDDMDDWSPIDQYCRDRLVAVCEFFVFIRNIQLGLYSDRPIDDLYAENIRLRLQMFYSRYVLCILFLFRVP
ncbi:uncharacterized protein BYT42DRAFT_491383 [Radiomyces spectabilis]|uniref:uncharacterized protein n=1 Tax=Radiomyces spectabilis TaxID=64574 RepID=UPI0022209AF2|nr:uncharacterized protein BYT42DRAFT_491383 [Radiomyces spectabilis]KAI8388625.1 hypothetical protein BYT42DRAFT_491383 [Radiomyces spectabilis]